MTENNVIHLTVTPLQVDALNRLSLAVTQTQDRLTLYLSAVLEGHGITKARMVGLQADPPTLEVVVEEDT